jgi:hypothetical protein
VSTLAELYAEHSGRVSQKWDGYLVAYDQVLADRRGDRVALLEIGVQNGGSLEVWSRYLPEARLLVGCDVDPACGRLTFDDPRLSIVVDDGSHRSDDIIRAFVGLLPLLADGGVYIVEDLHCSYLESFGGGLFAQRSALGFLRRLVDVINIEHWGLDLGSSDLLGPLLPEGMDDGFLAALPTLRSVEFLDSLCVVRIDRAGRTRLGSRIVVGEVAAVDGGPLAEAGRPSPRPTERAAAAGLDPIRQEDTIRDLEAEVARVSSMLAAAEADRERLRARLDRILSSRSWRLTSGLRAVFRFLFRRG